MNFPSPADSALSAATRRSWQRQAMVQMTVLWPLKALGTMAFMIVFFWGYFGVLRNPLSIATLMPLTPVDTWIPFAPSAFWIYASLWVYVSLPPALQPDLRHLHAYGFWISALCLFGLAVFWLWPTTIPRPDIDWAAYPEIALIKGIDLSGNACPSLHVATAIFSAFWLQHLMVGIRAPRWLMAVSWLHCAAIVWSTIAVRQHVFVDVLAGAALGLLFAVLSLRAERRRPVHSG